MWEGGQMDIISGHLQGRPLDGVQQQSGASGHSWVHVFHRGQEAAESMSQGILQQVVFGHCTDVQEPTKHCHLLHWELHTEWN